MAMDRMQDIPKQQLRHKCVSMMNDGVSGRTVPRIDLHTSNTKLSCDGVHLNGGLSCKLIRRNEIRVVGAVTKIVAQFVCRCCFF